MKYEAHLHTYSRELLNDQPRPLSPIVGALVSAFRRAETRVRHSSTHGGVSGARIPNYRRSRIDIRGTIRSTTSYKRRRDNIKQVQGLRGPVGESHTGHAPEHASFTVARHRHLSEFPPSSLARFPLPTSVCVCVSEYLRGSPSRGAEVVASSKGIAKWASSSSHLLKARE